MTVSKRLQRVKDYRYAYVVCQPVIFERFDVFAGN